MSTDDEHALPGLGSDPVARLVAVINRMAQLGDQVADLPKEHRARIAQMYAKGASHADIGNAVGLSRDRISRILNGVGKPPHAPQEPSEGPP